MARVIADILQISPIEFAYLVEDWEKRTERKGHDLTLYSDMRSRAAKAIKELGLDPSDTITGELYYALQERAHADNEWLCKQIGVKQNATPEEVIKKIVVWVKRQLTDDQVWVCKPAYMRTLLKKQPPKATMKVLGLRSVDSMLKRNATAEILTYSNELETLEWIKRFKQGYKKCKTTDFDAKPIDFLTISKERISRLAKATYPISRIVSPNYELGSIVLISPSVRFPLDVLAIMVLLCETIYEIKKHNALFRTLSVRKDFGWQFMNVCMLGITHATLEMSDIGWNSLHRHLVGNDLVLSKIEQPHVSRDDLQAESALDLLTRLDDRFNYWKHLEYVVYGPVNKHLVSLNLVDVVLNASNKTPYQLGYVDYARMRLWEELWARYLTSDQVIEDVIDSYLGPAKLVQSVKH